MNKRWNPEIWETWKPDIGTELLSRQALFIPLLNDEGGNYAQDIVGPYSCPTKYGSNLPSFPFLRGFSAPSFNGAISYWRGKLPWEIVGRDFDTNNPKTWSTWTFWYYLPHGTTQKGIFLCNAGPNPGWPYVLGHYFGIGTGDFATLGTNIIALSDPWGWKQGSNLHAGWNFICIIQNYQVGNGVWSSVVDAGRGSWANMAIGMWDRPIASSYLCIGSHWGDPPGGYLTGGAMCLIRLFQKALNWEEMEYLYFNPFIGLFQENYYQPLLGALGLYGGPTTGLEMGIPF